jgi:hypothetical protein
LRLQQNHSAQPGLGTQTKVRELTTVHVAQEKIVKLELEVEQLRTALSLIYEISQDRINANVASH